MRTQAFVLAIGMALFGSACSATVERPLLIPAPGSPIHVGDSPGSIALGDVNQDGKLDLAATGGRSVIVLLGEGDGRFHPAPGGPIRVTDPPTELVLQDLNGDAKPDLATWPPATSSQAP